jgi:hypothetical protein
MNQVLDREFSLTFVAVYDVYFQQVYNWLYKTDGNLIILVTILYEQTFLHDVINNIPYCVLCSLLSLLAASL